MSLRLNTRTEQHIVFACGATGGQLYPGLATAEQCRANMPGARITFCGAGGPFERTEVFKAGFDYKGIPCRPWPRTLRTIWRSFKENARGSRMATDYIKAENVSLVVAVAGLASWPMARAAIGCGVDLVLLEQNAVPSRVTRWLASAARLVCLSIPTAQQRLPSSVNVAVTGTPIRVGQPADGSFDERTPRRRLMVLSGTRATPELNESVPRALYKLKNQLSGWQIIHQTGPDDCEQTGHLYRKLSIAAEVVPYIDGLTGLLNNTDLVVTSAGSSMLAELALHGVPAILLPDVQVACDQQRENARYYTRASAAVTVDAKGLIGRADDELAERIFPLLNDEVLRVAMSEKMSRLGFPNAARDVSEIVAEILAYRGRSQAA